MALESEAAADASQDLAPPDGPLVSEYMHGFSSLLEEYADADERHLGHCHQLQEKYRGWRRIKGDGDCLFRAFIYGYLESLLRGDSVKKAVPVHEHIQRVLFCEAGFDERAMEDFIGSFDDCMEALGGEESPEEALKVLHGFMNDPARANSMVFYFRMIASGVLRRDSDEFAPFFDPPVPETVVHHCVSAVEVFGHPGDDFCIQALVRGLSGSGQLATCRVVSMDTAENQLATFEFSGPALEEEATEQAVWLLFRPGHYDLLYNSR